ncbi:MAG: hypothetical protein J3Q66DRAFT_373076 [Benniella sp.]|nr:MAG: hypothetical protein J3Q66DRAFT_373076 [Benniella sp.]
MKVTSAVLTLSALVAVAVATTLAPSQEPQDGVYKGPRHEGEPHGHGNVTHPPHGRPGGSKASANSPESQARINILGSPAKGRSLRSPAKVNSQNSQSLPQVGPFQRSVV